MSGFYSSSSEILFCINKTINKPAGSHNINVFKLTGSVQVIEQVAEITRVGTLTNCTSVYADLYDGTIAVDLTKSGITLSGATVGSIFFKDQTSASPYTLSLSNQCRLAETSFSKIGAPFIVTSKNGVDTYIRFNLTTTDDPIDFDLHIRFGWRPVDGGILEIL